MGLFEWFWLPVFGCTCVICSDVDYDLVIRFECCVPDSIVCLLEFVCYILLNNEVCGWLVLFGVNVLDCLFVMFG